MATALNAAGGKCETERSTRTPRVVLLTMGAGPDVEDRTSGADDVVFKGCASETLLKSLRGVLRTR